MSAKGHPVCDKHNVAKVKVNDRSKKQGYLWRCRSCASESAKKFREDNPDYWPNWWKSNRHKAWRYRLEHWYGLSEEEYWQLVEKQDQCCAICGRADEERALCVDHCHVTGKVRGLLCIACNRGIGYLQDSKEILRKATEYLEDSKA